VLEPLGEGKIRVRTSSLRDDVVESTDAGAARTSGATVQFSVVAATSSTIAFPAIHAEFAPAPARIETLGEAYAAGWRVRARSAGQGRTDGPTARSSRECTYRHELDVELDVHFVVHNCPMTMS
jgi:hypothetical protein